jgi:hypothetical protein
MKVILTEKQIRTIVSEQISYDEALNYAKDIEMEVVNRTEDGVVVSLSVPAGKPHKKVSADADEHNPKSWTYFPITLIMNVEFKLYPVGKNPIYCKWVVGNLVSLGGDELSENWDTYLTTLVSDSYTPGNLIDKLMHVGYKNNKSELQNTINRLNSLLEENIPDGKIDVNKI